MSTLTTAQFGRAKALVRSVAAKRQRIELLTRLVEAARIVATADAQSRDTRLGSYPCPEKLAGLAELFQRTDQHTRFLITMRYGNMLADMLEPPYPGAKPRKVDFNALPQAARPYLLAPYLNLVVGKTFPSLCLATSAPSKGCLVYVHTGGPATPASWQPLLPQVAHWLGGSWQLTAHTATTITLTVRQPLPALIPMTASLIGRGALFTGIDTITYQPANIQFANLTSGTFVVGASGTGKSNALHILLQSIFANLGQFNHVYLVDGKDGVAFNRYANRHPKITVLWDEPDLWALTSELVATMRTRNAAQRANGTDNATGDFIAVVIDEMSTYTAKPSSDGKSDANKAHVRFLDELAMLARRGRSTGLRMIITAQEPTDNQIPTTVRNNCLTTIAFRLPIDAHATAVFGQLEGLLADPRQLTRGRALIKHGMTGDMQLVQFPVILT